MLEPSTCSVKLPYPEAQLTGDVLNGCSRRVSDHTPAGARSRARLATKSSRNFGCQFVAERGDLGAEPRPLEALGKLFGTVPTSRTAPPQHKTRHKRAGANTAQNVWRQTLGNARRLLHRPAFTSDGHHTYRRGPPRRPQAPAQ